MYCPFYRIKIAGSLLLIALFLFFVHSGSNAQDIRVDTIKISKTRIIRLVTIRTPPKFILQINGSYNWGAMELSEHNGGFSRDDFKLGKSYGARNGFGITLTGKMRLHRKGLFWLDATSSFNRFISDLITKNTQQGKVSYNVFSGGVGLDYNFTSAHKVKYFIGANTQFSTISGEAELVAPDSTTKYKVKINSSFRIGYSVYIGLEYAFEQNFGLNFGLKFTHSNLLLKKSSAPSSDSTQTGLNDDGTKQIYSGWKQFAYASVFGGFSYYFGVRERRYKLP